MSQTEFCILFLWRTVDVTNCDVGLSVCLCIMNLLQILCSGEHREVLVEKKNYPN